MKINKFYRIIDPPGQIFEWKKIKHPRFKYETTRDYYLQLSFKPAQTIESEFYTFYRTGILLIKSGYRWDGASGPTIDTISTMRASAAHDAIYQMFRLGQLSREFKKPGDKELSRIMKEDYHPTWKGAEIWSDIRAEYFYQGVNLFGFLSCRA